MKKYYIQTFGCQMNVHDSEQMSALLSGRGYERTDNAKHADFIVLNTCIIREKAEQKIYSQLGRFKDIKKQNPNLIIGVGGCLAQQCGDSLFERVPYLDLIFGTRNYRSLPDMLETIAESRSRLVETDLAASCDLDSPPVFLKKDQVSAYITIMQGCDNYCAYCIVPYVRGREVSREPSGIIEEAEVLVAKGVKEITLLGQNVNSYGKNLSGKPLFPELLHLLGKVKGLERIRFTTSHPKDLSSELMNCYGSVGSLCEHIHLPVQSGSDDILRLMNRGYTSEEYIHKVAELRRICPEVSITSDVIVGFPGETEADFIKTVNLMETIKFDNLFLFKYSERSGTEAERFSDKVGEEVKGERLRILQSLQEGYTLAKNKLMEGAVTNVLVEDVSRNSNREIMGRTRTNKIVNFPGGRELIGRSVSVVITRAYQHSLRGLLPCCNKENGNAH